MPWQAKDLGKQEDRMTGRAWAHPLVYARVLKRLRRAFGRQKLRCSYRQECQARPGKQIRARLVQLGWSVW